MYLYMNQNKNLQHKFSFLKIVLDYML